MKILLRSLFNYWWIPASIGLVFLLEAFVPGSVAFVVAVFSIVVTVTFTGAILYDIVRTTKEGEF